MTSLLAVLRLIRATERELLADVLESYRQALDEMADEHDRVPAAEAAAARRRLLEPVLRFHNEAEAALEKPLAEHPALLAELRARFDRIRESLERTMAEKRWLH